MDSLKSLSQKYPKTYKLLQNYLNLSLGNVKVRCPYWINKIKKGVRGPYGGKGLPGQLEYTAIKAAKKNKINLKDLNKSSATKFLTQNKIGVDCSGFAYNILNKLDKEMGGNGIADNIFGQSKFPDWNPAWRASAAVLTSSKVSRRVAVKDVRLGDIVRLDGGKHIMVVVGITPKTITYAHSSKTQTKTRGVHIAKINVINKNKDLYYQNWKEKTTKGLSLGRTFIFKNKGDGLRRFNWW